MAGLGKTTGESTQGERISLIMSEQTEYFVLVAILFAAYVCMRVMVVWNGWELPKPERPVEDYAGKGIDAEELSHRVQNTRKKLQDRRAALQATGFKRDVLVGDKREQIAKLAFFQNPPGPSGESQETEDGFCLLMV